MATAKVSAIDEYISRFPRKCAGAASAGTQNR